MVRLYRCWCFMCFSDAWFLADNCYVHIRLWHALSISFRCMYVRRYFCMCVGGSSDLENELPALHVCSQGQEVSLEPA